MRFEDVLHRNNTKSTCQEDGDKVSPSEDSIPMPTLLLADKSGDTFKYSCNNKSPSLMFGHLSTIISMVCIAVMLIV